MRKPCKHWYGTYHDWGLKYYQWSLDHQWCYVVEICTDCGAERTRAYQFQEEIPYDVLSKGWAKEGGAPFV